MSKKRFGFLMVTIGLMFGYCIGGAVGFYGHDKAVEQQETYEKELNDIGDKIELTFEELGNIWL